MKIQDVERQTGLDRATIRFYEKEGILNPVRGENGYRNYTVSDVDLLLKVKLLRKLGVALATIKQLQEGSEALSDVLSQQILLLEQKIQEDTSAKVICNEMLCDQVQYNSLDSLFYLEKLEKPHDSSDFHEEISTEIHPIRRYIARIIDLITIQTLLSVFLIMVVRIRPYINAPVAVLSPILGYLASIPISAVLLHIFGTTPGKWLMGIHLEDPNGGKLSSPAAMKRETRVLIAGFGFHIPVFRQIRLFISYRDVSNGKQTEWDREAEIQYVKPGILRILLAVISTALLLVLNYTAIRDAQLPKYRGSDLSMEQIVSNYQDYEAFFDCDNTMVLQPDGTWKKRTDYSVEITQIGDPNHKRQNFQYTFNESGSIHSITFSDYWDDIGFMPMLPDYCYTMLHTIVASRPGASVHDLNELNELLQSNFTSRIGKGGITTGEFTVHDVTFSWNAELPENYLDNLFGSQDKPIPYSLEFVITIE